MGITYNPRIVTDGLVLCLDAGNTKSYPGSGTAWTDLSGRGNTGTLTNGPTYSSVNGGSLSFNGSNQYTTLSPGNTFAFGTQPFAIEIWINFNSTGIAWYFIEARNSGQTTNWALFMNSSSKIEWFTGTGSLFFNDGLNPTWSAGYNGWKQIVVSRENTSTNGLKLYINGVLITSATDATNYSVSPTTSYIGCRFSINEFATANFSKVSVYNGKALSAAEVSQNFNALRGRYGI